MTLRLEIWQPARSQNQGMRTKITLPGQPPQDAELVDVEEAKEAWNELKLADGSALRLKQVVTEVWRLVDVWDPEGNPQYYVKSAGILTVQAPEHLKRKLS